MKEYSTQYIVSLEIFVLSVFVFSEIEMVMIDW